MARLETCTNDPVENLITCVLADEGAGGVGASRGCVGEACVGNPVLGKGGLCLNARSKKDMVDWNCFQGAMIW